MILASVMKELNNFIKSYFHDSSLSNSESDYDALQQIQKDFLCKDFQYGGLKNVDIKIKGNKFKMLSG